MDIPPTDEPDVVDVLVAARQAHQARRTREIADLLRERDDLRGVNRLADLVSDQAAWCA